MANDNPFAPPRATVRDVDSRTQRYQEVSAFTYKGRIGRLRLLAYSMGAYIFVALAAVVLALLKVPEWGVNAISIVAVVGILLATIQRSHDMDWSGWTCLLSLIPFVGLIWFFKAGTQGDNRFGAPPPPNTTGVKILAFVMPVIAIIGIVAAIALPAYSDYTKRAKANQAQTAPAPTTVPAPATP
jgi:uncharacterized membrane protein YhaH (DUF805 family)